jgi:hypothetical protein
MSALLKQLKPEEVAEVSRALVEAVEMQKGQEGG